MVDILDFEELMNDLENERKSEKKEKKSKQSSRKTDGIKTNYGFLYSMSRMKIEHYIKGTTKYKTINKQISLLNNEIIAYKKAGRKDLVDQTKLIVDSLKESIKDLNSLTNEKNIKLAREKRKKSLEDDETIKNLRKELKELKQELKNVRPSSLFRNFKDLKKRLNISTNINKSNKIIDFDDIEDIEDIEDIDIEDLDNLETMLKNNDSDLMKEYVALCNYIGEILDMSADDVSNSNPNELYSKLKKSHINDEYLNKKSVYEDKKSLLLSRISDISSDSISKIVYDNFDFEVESDVNDAMDLLAASRTTFVASMAYVFCKKYNCLREVETIIGYGLMALSEALNRWKKFQKQAYEKDKNNIIDIDLFLGVNITGPMIKGIYEIKNKGMMNPSTSIGVDMKNKSDYEKFKKDNPDLAGLPEEQIRSVFEYQMINNSGENNYYNKNVSVTSESEFGQMVASAIEEDGGDLWANMMIDRESMNQFDSIDDFNDILKIIEIMFSLYKKNGRTNTLSKKMFFDKIDYSIFRKIIGIEVNEEDKDGRWTQEQIAKNLTKEFDRSFTQGAVQNRLNKIYLAIKKDIPSDYPNLAGGLKDLKQYFLIKNNVSIFQSKIAKDPKKFENIEKNILSRLK